MGFLRGRGRVRVGNLGGLVGIGFPPDLEIRTVDRVRDGTADAGVRAALVNDLGNEVPADAQVTTETGDRYATQDHLGSDFARRHVRSRAFFIAVCQATRIV